MKDFFSYVFGVITHPKYTIDKASNEKNHILMTLGLVFWINLLLLVFLGIVTGHRLLTWNKEFILSVDQIMRNSVVFIGIINLILFVISMVHFVFAVIIERHNSRLKPGLFFPYLVSLVFVYIALLAGISYHFIKPMVAYSRMELFPILAFISGAFFGAWGRVLFWFSGDRLAGMINIHFYLFASISTLGVIGFSHILNGI